VALERGKVKLPTYKGNLHSWYPKLSSEGGGGRGVYARGDETLVEKSTLSIL